MPDQGIAYAESVPLDWNSGALAEGMRCYRNCEFFLAHEHWESVWLELNEPEKSFLQALIQTTAAFHHLQSGNPRGTVSLLRRAMRRFEACPGSFAGIDLTQLRNETGAWLLALENGASSRPSTFPQIRSIDHPANRKPSS